MTRCLNPILVLVLLAAPAFSWNVNTHLQMTRDAVALLPPEFQKTFTEQQKFVEAGIKDPDELIQDWPNHYYIPASNEGGALTRIDQIIKIIQIKMKSSTQLDVSKQLCYLAHYIGDLWTPEYLIKQNTSPDKDFVQNTDLYVFWEGYSKPIEDPHDYLLKRSQWRWRLEADKKISPLLYSEAVNDIARIWLTLYQQSGKTVNPVRASVIEHKIGSLNVNFQRLLVDENVDWYEGYNYNNSWENQVEGHLSEENRLYQAVNPSDEALIARSQARQDQQMMAANNPSAPFQMLESSMRTVGDKAYFVARVRNKGKEEIGSLAFMYPGVRGPVGMVRNLKPGQIAKIDSTAPVNADKNQIQVIYSAVQPAAPAQ